MPITLADLRGDLFERTADLLAALGLSTSTDAANSNFDGPIGWGYHRIGKAPLSGLVPTDADDLLTLSTPDAYTLLDFAEYRLLANVRNRWTQVQTQVGSNAMYLNQVRDALDRRLTQLEKILKLDQPVLVAGSIRRTQSGRHDIHDLDCEEFGSLCSISGRWWR